jgi:hypothetical protein
MSRNWTGRLLTGALLCIGIVVGLATPTAHAISAWVESVSADALGSVYISGYTHDSLGGPNAGHQDAFIARYDAAGNLQWIRQFGTSNDEFSKGVSADGLGNVYMSGSTSGNLFGQNAGGYLDAFVAKYDSQGNSLWGKQLGSSPSGVHQAVDLSEGVSTDGLGNVYISGSTRGSLDGASAGFIDAYLAKYDAAGNHQWTRQLGTSQIDDANGVSADAVGNVYISGFWGAEGFLGEAANVAKYDAAGNLQWTKQLPQAHSNGVSADGVGNVYISGDTFGSLGGPDAFVAKYDAAGNLQWTKQLGTSDADIGNGVSADGVGNVYVTGYTEGSLVGPNATVGRDAFVAKYDSAGNFQWVAQFGVAFAHVRSEGVSADGLGNVYISGFAEGSVGANAFVAKYDSEGNFQWIRQLGDNEFVPEPGSWLLAALASAAVLWSRKRRN